MWDLVPWPGIKLTSPSLGVWSLSYWTTREIPVLAVFEILSSPVWGGSILQNRVILLQSFREGNWGAEGPRAPLSPVSSPRTSVRPPAPAQTGALTTGDLSTTFEQAPPLLLSPGAVSSETGGCYQALRSSCDCRVDSSSSRSVENSDSKSNALCSRCPHAEPRYLFLYLPHSPSEKKHTTRKSKIHIV